MELAYASQLFSKVFWLNFSMNIYKLLSTFSYFCFEKLWQAVELWLTDKVVLPIENTSGGSIHRNYDLLLRHRLHIVGEVQLATNFSLLALPGVRKEYLKRVLSHSQVSLHHFWLLFYMRWLQTYILLLKSDY